MNSCCKELTITIDAAPGPRIKWFDLVCGSVADLIAYWLAEFGMVVVWDGFFNFDGAPNYSWSITLNDTLPSGKWIKMVVTPPLPAPPPVVAQHATLVMTCNGIPPASQTYTGTVSFWWPPDQQNVSLLMSDYNLVGFIVPPGILNCATVALRVV